MVKGHFQKLVYSEQAITSLMTPSTVIIIVKSMSHASQNSGPGFNYTLQSPH